MNRFIIYDPGSQTFIKRSKGGWTSGHKAEAVNSYASFQEAYEDIQPFDSLKRCSIIEVKKEVTIINEFTLDEN